jgi:carboxymethylenebutenolidase
MIKTDATGLTAGMVTFPASGGVTMPAYRALPTSVAGALHVVLVVQEIFGANDHIRDLCRRLAHAGYYAIAPELYLRQGDASKYTLEQVPQLVADIVSKVPQAQVLADLDACAAYAKSSSEAATAGLAITGFCWGGTITWLYCAHNSGVKAGAAWYGRLNAAASELQPRRPLDIVGSLHAPVLGLYGGQDHGIPLSDVEMMRAALHKNGSVAAKSSALEVYPDAGHGFLADYRPGYNEAAAQDGWQKMLAWFKHNGV